MALRQSEETYARAGAGAGTITTAMNIKQWATHRPYTSLPLSPVGSLDLGKVSALALHADGRTALLAVAHRELVLADDQAKVL